MHSYYMIHHLCNLFIMADYNNDFILFYLSQQCIQFFATLPFMVVATKAGDTRTMTEPKKERMKKLSFFHAPCFIFCLYARIGFSPSAN